jgi:hypothetical protein
LFRSSEDKGKLSFCKPVHDFGIDGLIDWLFTVLRPAQELFTYRDITIANEGLQNLGLCSTLRAFEQGGIFIVPHLLWHETSVFLAISSKGPPHSVTSYDTWGGVEDLF